MDYLNKLFPTFFGKTFGGKHICTACGSVGYPDKKIRGSLFLEIILWLCCIIPGLIYTIWRRNGTNKIGTCRYCNGSIVPLDSPVGQKLLEENKKY